MTKKLFNFKNVKKIFYILLLYLLISCSFFIIFLPNWIYKNFGNIAIEQILFTLSLPLKGTSNSLIKNFIDTIIFTSLKYSFYLILIFFIIYDIKYLNKKILYKFYKPLTFIFSKLVYIHNFIKGKKKIVYISIIVVISFFVFIQFINFIFPIKQNKFYYSNKDVVNEKCLIAHACGQIDNKKYTNSLEAITKSINNGYKLIEIDLCLTKNKEIVAMHDFKMFNEMTNIDNNISSAEEIRKQKIYDKYTPITAKEIQQIFNTNTDLILVTDKIEDYDILLDNFKFIDRMIVEVFSIQDYKKALKKGILYPALCFCYIEEIKDILKYKINMVTTHIDFFNENINIFKYLHKKGIVIMVFFGGNDVNQEFITNNLGDCCSLIYIDNTIPIREYNNL